MNIRRCPHCESTSVHRSRRRGVFEILLLRLFLVRPYQCWTCYRRHYGLASAHPRISEARKGPFFAQCPHCKSPSVHRSRRRGVFEILLLRLFLVRPYRCWTCYRRHYGLAFTPPRLSEAWSGAFFAPIPARAWQRVPVLPLLLLAVPLLFAGAGLGLPVLEKLGLRAPEMPRDTLQASSFVSVPASQRSLASSRQPQVALDSAAGWGEALQTETKPVNLSRVVPAAFALPQQTPLGSLRASGEVYRNETRMQQDGVVFPGDVLRTGTGSAAVLQVSNKGTIVISEQTRLSFGGVGGYFATLEQGVLSFATAGVVRDFDFRIGRFVVTPSPETPGSAAEILHAPDGSTQVKATHGQVGVIDLHGAQTVFISAGQEVAISPAGILQQVELTPPPPAPPAPQPPAKGGLQKGRPKSRATWVALGIGGGGAAAAAALLAARSGAEPVSPSAP